MIMMIIVIIIKTIVIIIVSWDLVVYDQVEHDFIRISTFFFSMRFICVYLYVLSENPVSQLCS